MASQNSETVPRFQINKELLPLKVFYFLMYGACIVIPFMTVVLKFLGLTASEIGLISGIPVIICMFTRTAIGMTADKLGRQKAALVFCCIMFGICFFGIGFIPRREEVTFTMESNLQLNTSKMEQYRQLNISKIESNVPSQFNAWICQNDSSIWLHSPTNLTSCVILQSSQENSPITYRCNVSHLHPFSCVLPDFSSLSLKNISLFTNNIRYKFGHFTTDQSLIDTTEAYTNVDLTAGGQNTIQSIQTSVNSMLPLECLKHCSQNNKSMHHIKQQHFLAAVYASNKTGGKDVDTHSAYIRVDFVFVSAMTAALMARVFYSSSTSLSDALMYSLLGTNTHRFARQRLWGSIGTGVATIVTTVISITSSTTEDLSALFYACLCLTCLASMVVVVKLNVTRLKKTANLFRDLGTVLSSSHVKLLLCKLVLFGYLSGSAQNFFMWFLSDIGASRLNLGLVVVINCVASVVVLGITGKILRRVGPQNTMYLVLCAYFVRFLLMSFISSPWLGLPVELLHGITYSMFWAAASGSIGRAAPTGTQATCQGIAGAVYWDFGRGVGTTLSGQLIQTIGARWTFRTYAGICILALPVFFLLDWQWPMPEQRKFGLYLQRGSDPSTTANGNDAEAVTTNSLLKQNGEKYSSTENDAAVNSSDLANTQLLQSNGQDHKGTGEENHEKTEGNEDISIGKLS